MPAVAEGEWKGASEWEGREKSWSPALLHAGARRREGSVGLGRGVRGATQGCRSPSHPRETAGDGSESAPLPGGKTDLAAALPLPGKTGPARRGRRAAATSPNPRAHSFNTVGIR